MMNSLGIVGQQLFFFFFFLLIGTGVSLDPWASSSITPSVLNLAFAQLFHVFGNELLIPSLPLRIPQAALHTRYIW
jgi:hypothetical protein